jgi:hypothetical protein
MGYILEEMRRIGKWSMVNGQWPLVNVGFIKLVAGGNFFITTSRQAIPNSPPITHTPLTIHYSPLTIHYSPSCLKKIP